MVVIGLNLSKQERGQMHLPDQIKHELTDSSGSQMSRILEENHFYKSPPPNYSVRLLSPRNRKWESY